MRPITTGFPTVDAALGGLITGDNVVWLSDDPELYRRLVHGFVGAAMEGTSSRGLYVDLGEGLLAGRADVERVDATVGSRWRSAAVLADELERRVRTDPPAFLVIDPLTRTGPRWPADTVARFFERICPAMLQAGVTAYWCVDAGHGRTLVEHIRQITQCLLDVRDGRMRVLKAEGRPDSLLGISYRLHVADAADHVPAGEVPAGDTVTVSSAPAGGRLARGLVALRAQLHLTQQELAAIAGVTPSAVSQAEAGTRGLSLDTVMTIADRLGMPIDRLLGGTTPRGYRLARHDRARRLPGDTVTALAGDSTVGLRAYLVELRDTEWAAPPFEHHGVAAVAVQRGLVQLDLADDRPVLRAGDTLLAEDAPVRAWRRLRHEPATCFWFVRDEGVPAVL